MILVILHSIYSFLTVQNVFLLLCYTFGRNEGTIAVILTIQI